MAESTNQKLPFSSLTALVVGSMVGAGIFALPSRFGAATGVFGALIAWLIAGIGMLMLAFVFQFLVQRKRDLDAGVFAYAREGFSDYPGFLSAIGYWAGSCIGNVSYWILISSTLGLFFPVFGEGNTAVAIAMSSVFLWGYHFLILRGVKEAAAINNIVTIAKILPIIIFIILVVIAFNSDVFSVNFWGTTDVTFSSTLPQVRATMLITVFVFLGIEGASVYSRYAQDPKDVGKATVLGFVGVLCLMVMITVFSYGVMPREQLAGLQNPSMASVLEAVVGRWGAIFVSIGLLISVLGAYLAWSLLAAEVLFSAAKSGTMPKFLTTENANGVPSSALWMSNITIQVFLILTFFTRYAFDLALDLTSSMNLIPYFLVAAYALQFTRRGETFENQPRERRRALIIGVVATIYTAFLLFAGGLKFVLLSALIYAPGTVLYLIARREQGLRVFTPMNWILFAIAAVAAVAAAYGIVTGLIEI